MSARGLFRDMALVALVTLGLIVWVVGPPRLYGVGCDAYPATLGFQLAQEESDFDGQCEAINRIPLIG